MATAVTSATISEIKALTAATTLSNLYYSTDTGKTGFWQRSAAPEPNTTANEGTVLKNSDNYVWRRIVENKTYYVDWFDAPVIPNPSDPFSGNTAPDEATVAINRALNAVVAGGTLIFTDGKMYSVSNLVIRRSITIKGKATLRKTMVSGAIAPKLPILRVTAGTVGVKIQDLTLDGNQINFDPANQSNPYTIPQNYITNYSDGYYAQLYGIYVPCDNTVSPVVASSGIVIDKVVIKNTYNEALYYDCASDCTITNSTFENCGQPSYGFYDANDNYKLKFRYLNAIRFTYELNKTPGREFKDFTIEDNTFLQQGKRNGCIKFHAVAGSKVSNIMVKNNECNIGDTATVTVYDTVQEQTVTLTNSQDDLAILAMEYYVNKGGLIQDLNVIDNTINAATFPDPNLADGPNWIGKRPHTMGISLGGNAAVEGEGIYNANILHNQVTGCRKNGLEISGNYIVASNNTLVDCAFISVTATYMEAGMRQITISHNTVLANPGYARSNGFFVYFAGLVVQAIDNNIDDLTIEGNTFDIQHTILPGVDVNGNQVQVDISNQLADSIYIKSGVPNETGTYAKINNLNIVNNQIMGIIQNGITFDTTTAVENLNIAGNTFQYYDAVPDPNPGSTYPYYAIQFKSTRSTSSNLLMHKLFMLYNTFDGGKVVASQPLDPGANKGGQIVNDTFVANKRGNALLLDSTYTKDLAFCGNTVENVSIGVWTKRAVDRFVIANNTFIDATVELNVSNSTQTTIAYNQSL